jgi:hypothetical protein
LTIPSPDLEKLGRLVDALTPWLDQVVIIGGWAHRLYRFHPLAQQLDYPPLMTLDADIALPGGLKVKGQDIHDRLTANGFRAELLGHHKPPATHYQLSAQSGGFYAEFLTPLIGGAYARGGRRSATARIAGVVSQRLRYVDLLLGAPWTIVLSASDGFPFAKGKQVLVANPVSFLAQKAWCIRSGTVPSEPKTFCTSTTLSKRSALVLPICAQNGSRKSGQGSILEA